MKKLMLIYFVVSSLSIISCSSNDDSSNGNEYPKTVNIKFEVIANTGGNLQEVETSINNEKIDHLVTLPFTYTYTQQEVNAGTYLKVQFQTLSFTNGENIELRILVDNQTVENNIITITQENQVGFIEYTFE
jgi:hypothetical protein